MERVLAREVRNYIGKEILLKGWIHQIRPLGKIAFILLRDRSGIVQTIVTDAKQINLAELERESAVAIWGKVKEEPQAPGGIEVEVKKIDVIAKTLAPLPFEVNRSQEMLNLKIDMILDHRPFSLRNPEIGSVFRVQAEICRSFAEFMRMNDFLEVHTSKIIAQGTEGGTALFPIQYFEQKAYLAQSPQFYKQMLVGAGYERVFEIGFVYRAEDHATSRHINEYLSLDFEMGFIDSYQEVIDLEIAFLKYLFNNLRTNCAKELAIYQVDLPEIKEIPQIRLLDAINIIKKEFGKESSRPDDLDPEGEKLICEYTQKKYGSDFVYITNYPASARPFYTMPDLENPGLTKSFDLLYKGLEVTTGSQRIHDYNMLVENIRRFNMDPNSFEFYLEIFRYGMPPHGGLAIGTERLTQQILGLKNVREASFFPRDRYRLTP
ncbi:MAG: aspartate--tRNA(Asn) ligase [candidate division WOR-3 bacterium]